MTTSNPDPLRMSIRTAAAVLDCCEESVRRSVRSGVLSRVSPRGIGPGKPVYLIATEVRLFAAGKFAELREYQRRRREGA